MLSLMACLDNNSVGFHLIMKCKCWSLFFFWKFFNEIAIWLRAPVNSAFQASACQHASAPVTAIGRTGIRISVVGEPAVEYGEGLCEQTLTAPCVQRMQIWQQQEALQIFCVIHLLEGGGFEVSKKIIIKLKSSPLLDFYFVFLWFFFF